MILYYYMGALNGHWKYNIISDENTELTVHYNNIIYYILFDIIR